jgi:hypothetical protein
LEGGGQAAIASRRRPLQHFAREANGIAVAPKLQQLRSSEGRVPPAELPAKNVEGADIGHLETAGFIYLLDYSKANNAA